MYRSGQRAPFFIAYEKESGAVGPSHGGLNALIIKQLSFWCPMEKLQIASKILLSIALIYLSTAIILFVVEAGKTRRAIPEIFKDIDRMKVDADIPKIVGQISEITKEIALVRQEIPAILKEVDLVRQEIPAILKEVAASREAVPPILEQVDEINRQIPEILRQVEETRKIVPPVLEEVAAVRRELPQSLDKAEKIVKDVKEISVVSGVATDIVTSPFKLIKKGVDMTGSKQDAKDGNR